MLTGQRRTKTFEKRRFKLTYVSVHLSNSHTWTHNNIHDFIRSIFFNDAYRSVRFFFFRWVWSSFTNADVCFWSIDEESNDVSRVHTWTLQNLKNPIENKHSGYKLDKPRKHEIWEVQCNMVDCLLLLLIEFHSLSFRGQDSVIFNVPSRYGSLWTRQCMLEQRAPDCLLSTPTTF